MELQFSDYPITLAIILVNVLLSLAAFNNGEMMNKMLMWPYGVKRYNQYYRFLSSGFIHLDYVHLLFNMLTLYFFGKYVEVYFTLFHLGGGITYLALYLLAMIAADIPSYFKHQDHQYYSSLGASGAVSAIVFSAIVFNPWAKIELYGIIGLSGLLYGILYIFFCVWMAKRGGDHINHSAHLWGSIFGFAATVVLIATLQPALLDMIIEQLKHPKLFGA